MRDYEMEFRYHLIDLSRYSDAEIKRATIILATALLLLKYIFRKELKPLLPEIIEILRPAVEQGSMEYLRTVAIYLCQATGKIEPTYLNEVLKTTFPKQAGGVMPTIAERWVQQGKKEGLQQGLQQGRIEGLQEGSASLALRILQRRIGKVDAKLQEQVRSLSFEQLKELGEALLDFTKPADLRAWLRAHRKAN